MEKERLHYIDVAKGLLILMVIYGHIYAVMHTNEINNTFADYIRQSCNLFISFYMPCFFVITGFCSNFKKPFFQFIFQSFKTIILPGFSLSLLLLVRNVNQESLCSFAKNMLLYGGNYWFLTSLFLAKIIAWIVSNCINDIRNQLIIYVLLFITGYLLGMIFKGVEPWYFVHSLLLTPYLCIGMLLKNNQNIINYIKVSCVFIISLILTIVLSHIDILHIDYFYHVPAISQMFININPSMFISLTILSVTGSIFILGISKWISSNRIIEYFGKNSLIFYCIHVFILNILIRHFAVDGEWFKIVFIYFVTISLCCMVSYVLNLKYIRCIIGKF